MFWEIARSGLTSTGWFGVLWDPLAWPRAKGYWTQDKKLNRLELAKVSTCGILDGRHSFLSAALHFSLHAGLAVQHVQGAARCCVDPKDYSGLQKGGIWA